MRYVGVCRCRVLSLPYAHETLRDAGLLRVASLTASRWLAPDANAARHLPSIARVAGAATALTYVAYGLTRAPVRPRRLRIVATREGPADTMLLMQQTWLGRPVLSAPRDQRLLDGRHVDLCNAIYACVCVPPAAPRRTPLRHAIVISCGAGGYRARSA